MVVDPMPQDTEPGRWKCLRCSYEWDARVLNPKECPACKQRQIERLAPPAAPVAYDYIPDEGPPP